MFDNKKVLAIIPARGGSKGLPGKNIKNICGKPLIAWTIEEALKSKNIDLVVVSSDDEAILNIAREFGANIPFVRPLELAQDDSKGIDVIKHAINYFKDEFQIVIVLQPTSPLRTVSDIDSAFEALNQNNAKAVVSVCELDHPLQWVNTLPTDRSLSNFLKTDNKNQNRQTFEKNYRLNGAIYIADTHYLNDMNGFIGDKTYALVMNRENSVDIDDALDFKIAEMLLKERQLC